MILACLGLTAVAARAESGLPGRFVYLRDVAPTIEQDVRYATPRNFTGKPVPGYGSPQCILKREAAEALKRAQDKARSLGFSLKVYDCYRPARAVRAFLAWAAAPEDGRTKGYYPHLRKSQLVPTYIAGRSSHSTGASMDVTLIPLEQAKRTDASSGNADCTAPATEREADDSFDMGTAFDCFDPKANTDSPLATPVQQKSRTTLKIILESAGFKNYAGEWWHFTFMGAKGGGQYDFPIKPRSLG